MIWIYWTFAIEKYLLNFTKLENFNSLEFLRNMGKGAHQILKVDSAIVFCFTHHDCKSNINFKFDKIISFFF